MEDNFIDEEIQIKFEATKISQGSEDFYKILVLLVNSCKQEIFDEVLFIFYILDYFGQEKQIEIKRSEENTENIEIYVEGELKYSLLQPNSSTIHNYLKIIIKQIKNGKS